MHRLLGSLVGPALAFALILLGAYGWFTSHITRAATANITTDGIVVLTGEPFRLSEAVRLLVAGKAKRLLISGVNVDVSPELLKIQLKMPDALFNCCVDFGYHARNTLGNATETAEWAAANNIHTLRVVTAAYHMPRSLIELHRAAPNLILYPNPVTGRNKTAVWWMPKEFAKYFLVLLRNALGDPFPLDRLFSHTNGLKK